MPSERADVLSLRRVGDEPNWKSLCTMVRTRLVTKSHPLAEVAWPLAVALDNLVPADSAITPILEALHHGDGDTLLNVAVALSCDEETPHEVRARLVSEGHKLLTAMAAVSGAVDALDVEAEGAGHITDFRLGAEFARTNANAFAWEVVPGLDTADGNWYAYNADKGMWAPDTHGARHACTRVVGPMVWDYARIQAQGKPGTIRSILSRYASGRGVSGALADAATRMHRNFEAEQAGQPHRLLMPNGVTIDVESGERRKAEPSDGFTRALGVAVPDNFDTMTDDECEPKAALSTLRYQLAANHEHAEVEAAVAFVQAFFGSMLAADVNHEWFMFLCGLPGTGKGTLMNPVARVLGSYAQPVSGADIAPERPAAGERFWTHKAAPPTRALVATEVSRAGTWDGDTIQQITSRDTMTWSRKMRDQRNGRSIARLVVSGNHRPHADPDIGLFRRMVLFEYTRPVTEADRDPRLRADADGAELPLMAAWMARGARRVVAEGMPSPPAFLLDATHEYERTGDLLLSFLDEQCAVTAQTTDREATSDLFTAFREYAIDDAGESEGDFDRRWSPRKFGSALTAKGMRSSVAKIDGKSVRVRLGVRLNTPPVGF